MIGKRGAQASLFDVGNVYPVRLRPGSFEAQLASVSDRLFSDEDFREMYDARIGRPSVPPSQLALLVLLQTESGVSDEECVERSGCDLRWAAVLRRPAGEPLCAKSTLQLFRAHLVLHDGVRKVFLRSIEEARRAGLLKKGSPVRVAVDTKPMIGRGAVEDTYNLLARVILKLSGLLAREAGVELSVWLVSHDLSRYASSSVKGSADIDWSDEGARREFLGQIVADARRLLALVSGGALASCREADVLRCVLLQDVTEEDGSVTLKDGTARDRAPSATDPDQRHGHKSKRGKFTGHKTAIAVEPESQIIASACVLPGNAADASGALDLVRDAGENAECPVDEVVGDCAYGNPETRREFAEAGIEMVAKTPTCSNSTGLLPKSAFTIDLDASTVTCPEGQSAVRWSLRPDGSRVFRFGAVCRSCTRRALCTRSPRGRVISVHPHERMLQEARARQRSALGRALLRKRIVVEHRLARLAQLGIGRARYFGHVRTRLQILLACAVANFRRTWNWLAACGTAPEGTNGPLLSLLDLLQRLHAAIQDQPGPGWAQPTPKRRPLLVRLSVPTTVATGRSKAGFRLCF